MTGKPAYIGYASWEERYVLGGEKLCSEKQFSQALIFYSSESKHLTAENRGFIRGFFKAYGCRVDTAELPFEQSATSWKEIRRNLEIVEEEGKDVFVDISTMPRNVIFTIFNLLTNKGCNVKSVYHSPSGYPNEPLCRDAGTPYLIFKLSGEFDLTKKGTVFIATVGFNPERVAMAIRHFEPAHVILGFQKGNPYENLRKSVESFNNIFGASIKAETFHFDTYGGDAGFAGLTELVSKYKNEYNIVMGSFGPKRTAAAMYRVYNNGNTEIGFCYVPMKTYDCVYSTGLENTFIDQI